MKAVMLVIALFVLVFCAPAQSLEYKNDISFGLGAFTYPDIVESGRDIGGFIGLGGIVRSESKRDGLAYILNYGRVVKEDVKLSLSFGFQKFDVDLYAINYQVATLEFSYYTFMVRGDYTWYRKGWTNLYSGAALGLSAVTEEHEEEDLDETEYYFAFHVNAIGARLGNRVAGFVELGFGYSGILSAGITAAF
jgi:hypothetical protein